MDKPIKIIYENAYYYLYGNNIVDENFLTVPEPLAKKIATLYFGEISYEKLTQQELLNYIKQAKETGEYSLAYSATKFGLDKFCENTDFVKTLLPIMTSLSRKADKSAEAIEYAEKYLSLSKAYISVPLLTSMAAAYCDLKDYNKALKVCNYAYKLQGGGVGYKNELSLVYKRIIKETGWENKF